TEQHNEKIENALEFLLKSRPSFAIVDKGRTADERSCIWIDNGEFHGMGYINAEIGISEPSQLKDYVTQYRSNQYIMQLINGFAQKHPSKVLMQEEVIASGRHNA